MPRIAHARARAIVRSRRLFLARGGNGCSKVLLVMPIGSRTHSRAISAKRLPDGVRQGELLNQHRAARILEAGQRRALQTNGLRFDGGWTPSRICGIDGSVARGA